MQSVAIHKCYSQSLHQIHRIASDASAQYPFEGFYSFMIKLHTTKVTMCTYNLSFIRLLKLKWMQLNVVFLCNAGDIFYIIPIIFFLNSIAI